MGWWIREKTGQQAQPRHVAAAVWLLFGVAIALPCAAHADDLNFRIDNGGWQTVKTYEQTAPQSEPGITSLPAITTPGLTPASAEAKAPAQDMSPLLVIHHAKVGNATGVIAQPARPLDLPPLPAINKNYRAQIDSTEDMNRDYNGDNSIGSPETPLPQSRWRNAAEVAKESLKAAGSDQDISVRMSFLPSPRLVPVPAAVVETSHNRTPLIKAQMAASAPPMPEAQKKAAVAACAAVDTYKKHQLQAIQSDRETLDALQAAIAQLGLQKQLNFITNPESAMNRSGANATASALPASVPAVIPGGSATAGAN